MAEMLASYVGPLAVPLSSPQTASVPVAPSAINATFNGATASGDFLACLDILSQDGKLISRTFPDDPITAGDTAEVTYAPFLRKRAAAAAATGGLTMLNDKQFTATGQFDFTAIPQTYKDLWLVVSGKIDFSDEDDGIRFNGDAAANYETQFLGVDDGSGIFNLSYAAQSFAVIGTFAGNAGVGNVAAAGFQASAFIADYTGTTFHKLVVSSDGHVLSPIAPAMAMGYTASAARWKSTAAISRITSVCSGGLLAGSRATLYGMS